MGYYGIFVQWRPNETAYCSFNDWSSQPQSHACHTDVFSYNSSEACAYISVRLLIFYCRNKKSVCVSLGYVDVAGTDAVNSIKSIMSQAYY